MAEPKPRRPRTSRAAADMQSSAAAKAQVDKAIAARSRDVTELDDLPENVRQVIKGCDFYIETPIRRHGINWSAISEMVAKVASEEAAAEVNRIIRQMNQGVPR